LLGFRRYVFEVEGAVSQSGPEVGKVIPEIQHWKQRELEISLDVTCRRLMQVDEAFGRITYRAAFFISAMGDQNQT
jgi:hypothetical protein